MTKTHEWHELLLQSTIPTEVCGSVTALVCRGASFVCFGFGLSVCSFLSPPPVLSLSLHTCSSSRISTPVPPCADSQSLLCHSRFVSVSHQFTFLSALLLVSFPACQFLCHTCSPCLQDSLPACQPRQAVKSPASSHQWGPLCCAYHWISPHPACVSFSYITSKKAFHTYIRRKKNQLRTIELCKMTTWYIINTILQHWKMINDHVSVFPVLCVSIHSAGPAVPGPEPSSSSSTSSSDRAWQAKMKHTDREVAARQTGASLSWVLEISLTPTSHSQASGAPGACSRPVKPFFPFICSLCTLVCFWGTSTEDSCKRRGESSHFWDDLTTAQTRGTT